MKGRAEQDDEEEWSADRIVRVSLLGHVVLPSDRRTRNDCHAPPGS